MKSFRVLNPFKRSVTFIADSVFVHAKKTLFPIRRLCSDKSTIKEVKSIASSSQKVDNKDDNKNDSKNDSKDRDKHSDNNSSSYWEVLKRKLTEYQLTLGGIGVFVSVVASAYMFKKDAVVSIDKLISAIKNAEITHSRSAHFISRPKIGEKINKALTNTFLTNDGYTIVYGPKGNGKTELVDHMAIGKRVS